MNRQILICTKIFFSSLLSIILLTHCGKDAIIGPSQIILSNSSIFELLPADANVAILSSDVDDSRTNFRLVSGEGATHNSDFVVKGNILKTKKVLKYESGNNRSIRLQVSDGVVTYEQIVNIEINQFIGTYPTISSPSFNENGSMPKEFGANHGNVSPDLEIVDVPSNSKNMVLTMIDLDDGNGFHWTVWNIPNNKTKISRGEPWSGVNVVVGQNNYGEEPGYTGPFPPSEHRYQITIYFLSENLNLMPSDFLTLMPSMTGKIIAQKSIIGKYKP
jgi:Raf kinase inhibitor-like YbhB/YbcL family protein